MTGLFVVFEGGDGVGKSTQTQLLCGWLVATGRRVVRTFEPGEGPVGAQIRRIVLSPETENLAPRAEALLFAADKAQHVHAVVRPALERGDVVVSDRYIDSTLAYQGAGRVLAQADLEHINGWATDGLRPDLTVLLDLEPARGVGEKDDLDRLERLASEFHERVRACFLELAAADPGRYLVLHARDPLEANAAAVRARVAALLERPEHEPEVGRRGLLHALFDPDAGVSEASGTMDA